MDELRDRVGRLEKGLAENTASTARVEKNTAEIVLMFEAAKGGFKVLGVIGSIIKWGAAVGASLAGLWLAMKGK